MVDCLFYWAVPIFFMLTGATLMDYRRRYDTRAFFMRRIQRVVVPFVAWSLIMLAWKVFTNQMDSPVGPRTTLSLIFNTEIVNAYWFFIPLFAVYLSLPVLSCLANGEEMSRKALWYAVVVAAALNILFPFIFSLAGVAWNASASLPLMGGYLVYVVLGYLLKGQRLTRRCRMLVYALGLVGFAARFLYTIALSDATGALDRGLWGTTNLPCFLQSIAVFVFARHACASLPETVRDKLSFLARYSFGVYLTHVAVMWYLQQAMGLADESAAWRFLGPFLVYSVSLLLVLVGKRVPGLCRLLP